jgi:hypothetical protein
MIMSAVVVLVNTSVIMGMTTMTMTTMLMLCLAGASDDDAGVTGPAQGPGASGREGTR